MIYRSLQSGHELTPLSLVSIFTAADPDSIVVGGDYADDTGTRYILRHAAVISEGITHCVLQAQGVQ